MSLLFPQIQFNFKTIEHGHSLQLESATEKSFCIIKEINLDIYSFEKEGKKKGKISLVKIMLQTGSKMQK